MSKRFTETNKWEDKFFRKLSPAAKLLYWYMWDRCDIAGFWEVDLHLASFCIGVCEAELESAFEELSDKYIVVRGSVWIKTFLKHQRNENLDLNNPAHIGILRKIAEHKSFSEKILNILGKGDLVPLLEDITCRGYKGATKGVKVATKRHR